MRHPPELLNYIVPVGLLAGIMAAVGMETDSTIAWCLATAAATLCISLVWPTVQYAWVARRAARSRGNVLRGFDEQTRSGDYQPRLAFRIFGRLNPDFLLREFVTACNVDRYLGGPPSRE